MDNSHHTTSLHPNLDIDNIRAIKVLGKGAMGTVFLVHDKFLDPTAAAPFALKVVEKSALHHRRARWEISVLSRLQTLQSSDSFLPSLLGIVETEEFLGWGIPYCPGSDLHVLRHRQSDHVFSVSAIRFYLAEIISALEKLHDMGIVYRDLKPENVLIQHSGHVTLTDFDLSRNLAPKKSHPEVHAPPPIKQNHQQNQILCSKRNKNSTKGLKKTAIKSARVSPISARERSYSFVGTEEYLSPEIIRGDGHEFAVDWWALGVLCYEMLYGTTPFKGKNKKETFQKILASRPALHGKPNALTDLIKKLLEKDPTRRLGYRGGACEIKEHGFFRGLKWDMLTEVVRPPFIPLRDENDTAEELAKGGIDIREYFEKLRVPPSPLWSPSVDNNGRSVSLTEF